MKLPSKLRLPSLRREDARPSGRHAAPAAPLFARLTGKVEPQETPRPARAEGGGRHRATGDAPQAARSSPRAEGGGRHRAQAEDRWQARREEAVIRRMEPRTLGFGADGAAPRTPLFSRMRERFTGLREDGGFTRLSESTGMKVAAATLATAALAGPTLAGSSGPMPVPSSGLGSVQGAEVREQPVIPRYAFQGRTVVDRVTAEGTALSPEQRAAHRILVDQLEEYQALSQSDALLRPGPRASLESLGEDLGRLMDIAFPPGPPVPPQMLRAEPELREQLRSPPLTPAALDRLVAHFAAVGIPLTDPGDALWDRGVDPASIDVAFGRTFSVMLEGHQYVRDVPRDAEGRVTLPAAQRGALQLFDHLTPEERERLRDTVGYEGPTAGNGGLQEAKLGNDVVDEALLTKLVERFARYGVDLAPLAKGTDRAGATAALGAHDAAVAEEARKAEEARRAEEARKAEEAQRLRDAQPIVNLSGRPTELILSQLERGFRDAGRGDLANMVRTRAFDLWVSQESSWNPSVVSPANNQGLANGGLFQVWFGHGVRADRMSPYHQAKLLTELFPHLDAGDIQRYGAQIQSGSYGGWG